MRKIFQIIINLTLLSATVYSNSLSETFSSPSSQTYANYPLGALFHDATPHLETLYKSVSGQKTPDIRKMPLSDFLPSFCKRLKRGAIDTSILSTPQHSLYLKHYGKQTIGAMLGVRVAKILLTILHELPNSSKQYDTSLTLGEWFYQVHDALSCADIMPLADDTEELPPSVQEILRDSGISTQELDLSKEDLSDDPLLQTRKELTKTSDALKAAQARIKELEPAQTELTAIKAQLAATKTDLTRSQTRIIELENTQVIAGDDSTQRELARMRQELASSQVRIQELGDLQTQLTTTRSELASSQARIQELGGLQTQLTTTREELAQSQARVQELPRLQTIGSPARELTSIPQELEGVRAELEATKRRLGRWIAANTSKGIAIRKAARIIETL